MYYTETKSTKRSKSKHEEKAQVLLVPRDLVLFGLYTIFHYVVLWTLSDAHIMYGIFAGQDVSRLLKETIINPFLIW